MRHEIQISQIDDLTIDSSESQHRSLNRRQLPRFNGKTVSRIVSDLDHDGDDDVVESYHDNNQSSQGSTGRHNGAAPRQNIMKKNHIDHTNMATRQAEASSRPRNSPHKSGHTSAQTKKTRNKPAPRMEPLRPLSSSEHTNVLCRFVIKEEASMGPYTINVDTPIPSHLVWRVISPTQECPICLNVAEVPRMLSCGHIMCMHCMIEHRRLSEAPNVCPICGETVNSQPGRAMPVTFMHADSQFLPSDGHEAIFSLMARPMQSSLALPVDTENPKNTRKRRFPGPEFTFWTRVCQGDHEYAKAELSKELKYLIKAAKENTEEFGDDGGYGAAANEIKRNIQAVVAQQQEKLEKHEKRHSNKNKTVEQSTDKSAVEMSVTEKVEAQQGEQRGEVGSDKAESQPAPLAAGNTPGSSPPSELLYFYQSAFESSTVYTLDSLDVSMLKQAFGGYENFPSSLIAKVETVEHFIYDRRRDKRLKYLSHLPEQTPVALLTCDWTGVLDPETLKKFASRISERKQRKLKMQARDLEDRRKAEAAIERQFQIEIAEAMLPHADVGMGNAESHGIDTATLPSLPVNAASAGKPTESKWSEKTNARDELMKNAYVPKRGRKDIILRL